ncbi:hypothetical protein ACQP2K_10640 [Microbispora siamensis]
MLPASSRQALARRIVIVTRARQATPLPGSAPAGQEEPVPGARPLAGLRFAPNRAVIAVSRDGVAVAGPAGTFPIAALPGHRILFSARPDRGGTGGRSGRREL